MSVIGDQSFSEVIELLEIYMEESNTDYSLPAVMGLMKAKWDILTDKAQTIAVLNSKKLTKLVENKAQAEASIINMQSQIDALSV